MKRLLVTGAGGFLGWNLCNCAREKYSVIGVIHKNKVSIEGVSLLQCDLLNTTELRDLFLQANPDAVIHTAAASDPNFCQQHAIEARKINVDVSVELARLCAQKEIPFVFTSTDLVFDGKNPPYNEKSPTKPLCAYGEQKSEAEEKILEIHEKATICRMPLMFGDTPQGSRRFLQLWIEQLFSGKQLTLFTDEFRTPVSAQDAAQGLLMACEKVQGILHLGGHERISRYDFGRKLLRIMGISEERIIGCSQKEVKMAAPRPRDVSLDSSKAFALGYNPGGVEEELSKLKCMRMNGKEKNTTVE